MIASAFDHYSSVDIKSLAELKEGGEKYESITYFGDDPKSVGKGERLILLSPVLSLDAE